MSIDWLFDLERDIDNGKEVYACQGLGRNQWVIGKPLEELKKFAQKVAAQRKLPISVVRLVPKQEAVSGDMFLAPTRIGEPGTRGEPQIEWAPFDSKEAAENLRDVKQGPSPFFAMQIQETFDPGLSL